MNFDIPQNNAEQISAEKQAALDKIKKEVEGMKDGLGLGLDEGIKDAVIYAKALGLETYQSCEGHVERDGKEWNPVPYIHFKYPGSPENSEDEDLKKIYNDVIFGNFKKMSKERDIQVIRDKIDHDLDSLHESGRAEEVEHIRDWIAKNEQMFQQLKSLVDEFNDNRENQGDAKIIVAGTGEAGFSVKNNAGIYEEADRGQMFQTKSMVDIPPEGLAEKVEAWQEEMHAFTGFLKQKFLNE